MLLMSLEYVVFNLMCDDIFAPTSSTLLSSCFSRHVDGNEDIESNLKPVQPCLFSAHTESSSRVGGLNKRLLGGRASIAPFSSTRFEMFSERKHEKRLSVNAVGCQNGCPC